MGRLPAMAFGVALAGHAGAAGTTSAPWDLDALSRAPAAREAPGRGSGGVRAVFYDGLPWRGRPTRVFAYLGMPEVEAGRTVPAMVLVHGGGGSAFVPWVKLWMDRGYAAISMDTCGCVSGGGYVNHPRHEDGGPPGWGGFDQVDEPVRDQWTYHAVADVILANSLVRSLPGVDPERVGLTGVSWGGYLACIAAGVDDRFRLAAPVYGCGFLGGNSAWLGEFERIGPERARKWLALWDPSVYLPRVRAPMLWVDGTNDFAYPMDSLQKSYRLPTSPGSPRTLSTRVRMPHGHGGPGENPKEIHAFAEAILNRGVPLARVTGAGRKGGRAWVSYSGPARVIRAELNCTTDSGVWQDRNWQTVPAALEAKAGRASGKLPAGTTVYYFNLIDDRDLVVSSEHEELAAPAPGRQGPAADAL